MSSHGHGFGEKFAAFGQSEDDSGDGLGHIQYFVHTHSDVGCLQSALQLLVDFERDEADADVRLYSAPGEVEHGAYLNL